MTSLDDTIAEMANLCRDYDLIDAPTYRKICEGAGKKERVTQLTPKQFVAIRTRLKLSQAALAAAIGTSTSTIAKWEQGSNNISPMTSVLMRAADKYGIGILAC